MLVDWNNIYKIRIANSKDEFQHHEVVKLLLVMKILNKYKRNLSWTRLYTEFNYTEKKKCDVYYEDLKNKSVYVYEIQKKITPEWLKEIKLTNESFKVHNMTTDIIVIDLNKLSKNIETLNKQLDDYIY